MNKAIAAIGASVLIIGILILALTYIQFPHIEETPTGDVFKGYPLLTFEYFYLGVILFLAGAGILIFGISKREN